MASKLLWTIVSEGDTKASPGQDKLTEALKRQGSTVCKATWEAQAGEQALQKDVNDMLKAGCKINNTTFRNGNHRYTWQYAYSIEGAKDWLFSQKKS